MVHAHHIRLQPPLHRGCRGCSQALPSREKGEVRVRVKVRIGVRVRVRIRVRVRARARVRVRARPTCVL